MTSCTSPKFLLAQVEEQISMHEVLAADDTLQDVDSTPPSETLDELYLMRKALQKAEHDLVQSHGKYKLSLKEKSAAATTAFKKTFGAAFSFTQGTGNKAREGLFNKAEVVDGGVRITFTHAKKVKSYTFSLTSGSRSTSKGNTFINVAGFREFLDNYFLEQDAMKALPDIFGSEPGVALNTEDKNLESDYVHGDVKSMRAMLKKLHVMGGEKASEAELDEHLALVDKMDPTFFESLKLYVEAEADRSNGVVSAKAMNIKIKGGPASIGNQQSEASIYLEEVVHSMTTAAIASKTKKSIALKRQLDHLIELGRAQLTWEDFLPPSSESIDPVVEEAYAKKLYSYIFNAENADYEFLAKGVAQPLVAKALSTVQVRDRGEVKSILEKLQMFFSTVIDILLGNISAKSKDSNVKDALISLAYELGAINTKKSQKLLEAPGFLGRVYDIVFNDTDRVVADAIHKVTKKTFGKAATKAYQPMPEDLYGRVKWMSNNIRLSLVNPTYTKVMGALASSYGLRPDGTVREIVSGLFETAPVQKIAEFLVLQAGYVDKQRNNQVGITRDSVLSMFTEAPTREEEEALTEILADTDLGSLFGMVSSASDNNLVGKRVFDNATVRKILTDEDTLDKFIAEAKRALRDLDPTHYNWHSNQAAGLGIYMAKHQGTPAQNFNAENIVKGIHSAHSKQANKNTVKAVDELATLVAIKYSDVGARNTTAALMKKDWTGVQHVADVVKGFSANSNETVFKGKKTNKIKGYSREIYDDSIIVETALLEEREAMEAQGFTFRGKLSARIGDGSRKPMALYVTDSISRPERLRGGIRLNQLRSKGTTVSSAAYKQGEGFSNSVIRERSKRDINELQRIATVDAKKMESGEFTFKDSMFGVSPIINEDGKVVDYRYMMDKETKTNILKPDRRISEVMGRSFGSLLDKEMSAAHNAIVLETMKKDMARSWESGSKGKDGLTDFTLVGPNVADPEMRKMYYMLPREFHEFINSREDKTLAVRTSLKNAYFGYTQLSITDFPGLKHITPKWVRKILRIAEVIWMELVQIAKTNILMKMPTVTVSNFISNTVYLLSKGYNPIEVITMQLESFKEIKSYNKHTKRLQSLQNREGEIVAALTRDMLSKAKRKELLAEKRKIAMQLGRKDLKPARREELLRQEGVVKKAIVADSTMDKRKKALRVELSRVKGEAAKLRVSIKDSRINELVELGLDQSVEDITSNVVRDTNRVSEFFDSKLEKVHTVIRTGVDYLFLTKRTVPYKVVNEFLEITDLMSRDIQNTFEQRTEEKQVRGKEKLPRWWLDKQKEGYLATQTLTGAERTAFLKEAKKVRHYDLVEDYINYALPSSSFEEYLNKVGILMFTKYVKRIQRIIVKSSNKGPIKAVLSLLIVSIAAGLPTIHEQSFLAKEWYTSSIGFGNVFPVYAPTDILLNVLTPSLLKESTYQF